MPSVTRKSSSARAQRRDQIVAKLVAAVERLLEEGESYTELSVERLVKEAGISRSTFYVYFEDKGALLQAMTAEVMAQELEATQAWLDMSPDASYAEVSAALRRIIDVYRPYQALMGAVVDVAAYDANVRDGFGELVSGAADSIAQHIRAGQESGHVRPGLDPEATAGWLTWMTERGLYQLIRGADDSEVDRLAEAQATILWNTLYEGAPKRSRPSASNKTPAKKKR